MKTPPSIAAAICFHAIVTVNSLLGQGALTPPGPPAASMKSLSEVEPRKIVNAVNTPGDANNSFIIASPGSYYLANNITAVGNKHGISIQANDVTLDLNGFALVGVGNVSFGINIPVAQSGVTVRNGNIRNWGSGGINGALVLMIAEKLVLSDCTFSAALSVGNGSIVRDCSASNNNTGFTSGDRVQFSNCFATQNASNGFQCANFVALLDCISNRNGNSGIVTLAGCSIIRCSSTRNDYRGIDTDDACLVADCLVVNTGGNAGIFVLADCTVRNCTVVQTTGGIGITLGGLNCQIIGNTCDNNDVGILAFLNGSRIDGNSLNGNNVGVNVFGTHNIVVRNTARGNGTSYTIGAGNSNGPIVDLNAGGIIPATTSAWANFIH